MDILPSADIIALVGVSRPLGMSILGLVIGSAARKDGAASKDSRRSGSIARGTRRVRG